ncbi:MAG: glycosyltransferase [Bacteroidota bacterium]|nr:glycosyltransferase [Bacteroidota bacterium]
MRRVHLVHFYSAPGGIEVLSSRLVGSFSGHSFRVFIIRPRAEGQVDVYAETGIPVTYGSANNAIALFRLWRYVRSHRNDVFHLFNLGPYFLLALRLAGARRILYSIRGTRYWSNNLQRIVRRPLWRVALSQNIRVIANSEYSRQVFLEKVSRRSEVDVVYNPVGSERFAPPALERRAGMMKIVYVGRLAPGKNLISWIETAAAIHAILDNTLFEIYGSGPLEQQLHDKITSLSAGSYIFLKGYRSDIENVFREADLTLFLSEYESFGNVVVESILCGTPVIASGIPSMQEIFRGYPVFLLSAEGDIAGQVIARLRDYETLLSAAGDACRDFRKRFSEEAYIKKLDAIYNSFND